MLGVRKKWSPVFRVSLTLWQSPTAHNSVAPDHPVLSKVTWQPDCVSSVTHVNLPCHHPRALEELHEQKLIRQRTLFNNMYDSKFLQLPYHNASMFSYWYLTLRPSVHACYPCDLPPSHTPRPWNSIAHAESGVTCGFRHLLRVLEHVPREWGMTEGNPVVTTMRSSQHSTEPQRMCSQTAMLWSTRISADAENCNPKLIIL